VILKPKLVLADEPTGSLDLRIGEEVQDLLFRLNEEHKIALVVATHNREFAGRIGRRAELRAGEIFD
jgi:predicted ABC-type transport system involved in lysophospholipase L1 biosynthesis ATPase subunit